MLRHLPYKIHKIYLMNRRNLCKLCFGSGNKLATLIHSMNLKKKNLSKEMVIVIENCFQNCEVLPLCFLSGKPQYCSSLSINKSNMMNSSIHLERSLKREEQKELFPEQQNYFPWMKKIQNRWCLLPFTTARETSSLTGILFSKWVVHPTSYSLNYIVHPTSCTLNCIVHPTSCILNCIVHPTSCIRKSIVHPPSCTVKYIVPLR